MKKTATILGATGLIGGHLLEILKKETFYDEVRVISRRPLEINHPKVSVVVINFDDEPQFKAAIDGSSVVFCAIGTTQKKVKGDKKLYRKIDFDIPVNAAKHCVKYECKQFLIVSSLGADSIKSGFYLKLKGEVEDALKAKVQSPVGLDSLSIFRPSLLLGERSESRFAEGIGQFFGKALKFLMPGNSKPIEGENVAKAMVEVAKLNKKGVEVYHYKEMKAFF
ncbi:NAD(P)H-binding protein [Brumimicrobium oceani]|uniref:Segregation protein B n=1 Tax=Brumimicrobium oceani TaxID=2100725 RepID=A0A2U2XBF8_9FLAO|nr:NAD(P)H-binding protein [Brumimicrobium oceani]PWH85122.1 segregation protein B [Brumimicrobium oceani]